MELTKSWTLLFVINFTRLARYFLTYKSHILMLFFHIYCTCFKISLHVDVVLVVSGPWKG